MCAQLCIVFSAALLLVSVYVLFASSLWGLGAVSSRRSELIVISARELLHTTKVE